MKTTNISIIIPTYRRNKKMIQRAIESILNQTYKNYEILIIDDNNKNDEYYNETKKCEEEYMKFDNIKFLYHEENKGANGARNTGIENSKYKILAFLDSDDEWEEEYLEIMIDRLENSGAGLCYSGYYIINPKNVEKVNCNGPEGNIFEKEIILDRISPTSCVIIRKECTEKTGKFDNELPARQDFDMWVRITKEYKVATVNKPLVKVYRNGHESISSNYKKRLYGTERVYQKILESLSDNQKKEYEEKINWGKNKTLAELFIQNRMYQEATKYIKETLKYGMDFKLFLKLIVIKMGFYDYLVKLKNTK